MKEYWYDKGGRKLDGCDVLEHIIVIDDGNVVEAYRNIAFKTTPAKWEPIPNSELVNCNPYEEAVKVDEGKIFLCLL